MNEYEGDDWSLTSVLREVAEDDERLGASPAVEAALVAEMRMLARRRKYRNRSMAFALAAALVLAVAVPIWRAVVDEKTVTAPSRVREQADSAARELSTDFFPLAYSTVPAVDMHMVRIPVPRMALASFGATSFDAPNDRSSTVLADVVVGDDGLARAVRFVRVINPNDR